ncbi:hypothetical protein QCA50_008104 [Cerrena zonata]|uniref:Glycoside hydrolase family 76 protein n=1 Tax=Cerrena zonata TaxID=2478898 RepID=A0AAW0G5C8_9APHY
MPTIVNVLLLVAFLPLSLSQGYSVPSNWVNTTSSLSRAERVQLAQKVLDTLNTGYDTSAGQTSNLGFGQNANLLSAMAIHDSIISSKDNYNATTDRLTLTMPNLPPHTQGSVSNDPLMWGLTAIYAYRAYHERHFLDTAITIWDSLTVWMISPTDAQNGSHPLKNATFQSTCNGATIAGGVFYDIQKKNDVGVNAGTVGAYMALSAYLYEITSNRTYHDSADLTRAFIQTQLYNEIGHYVKDSLGLANCKYNNLVLTYNSGLYLEALSVFANATGNPTLAEQADQLALSSMMSSTWTGTNGVILEGPPNAADNSNFAAAYKGMLIRALFEHLSRRPRDSDIAKLISAFLTVQFNALLNNARNTTTNWYSPLWSGPPPVQMFPWGQLAAIDALNSAIGLTEDSASNPVPSASPPPVDNVHGKSHTGIIIGVTIGGFLLTLALGAAVFFLKSRRSHRSKEPCHLISIIKQHRSSLTTPEPFPPPLPAIDLAHSSKLREVIRQPPNVHPSRFSAESQEPPSSETPRSTGDSIHELLLLLTRALSRRPMRVVNGGSSIEPSQSGSV